MGYERPTQLCPGNIGSAEAVEPIVTAALHPNQFQVNEAWIVFRLIEAPVHCDDGSFNCFGVMDAASLYILHYV